MPAKKQRLPVTLFLNVKQETEFLPKQTYEWLCVFISASRFILSIINYIYIGIYQPLVTTFQLLFKSISLYSQ